MRRSPSFRSLFLAVLLFLIGAGWAGAQQLDASRAVLDQQKARLAAVDAALKNPVLQDGALQDLRGQLDPVADALRQTIDALSPQLDGVKSRLEQLGPRPDPAKNQAESPDVTRERAEQDALLGRIDEAIRFARLLSVQADQLQATIADRRRELFTSQLLERSRGLLSPTLWLAVADAAPRELSALRVWIGNGLDSVAAKGDTPRFVALALFPCVLAFAGWVGWRLSRRLGRRDAALDVPTRRQKAVGALRVIVLRTAGIAALAVVTDQFFRALDLLPPAWLNLLQAILWGVAAIVSSHALARAVAPVNRPQWRIFRASDETARNVTMVASVVPAIMAVGYVLDVLEEALVAALSITVATRAVVAVAAALVTLHGLRGVQNAPESASAASAGVTQAVPVTPAGRRWPLKLVGAISCVAVIAAALLGYVALASFLMQQTIWIASVGTVLAVALIVVDETVGFEISSDGKVGRNIQATLGLKSGSLQQIGILAIGFLNLAFIVIAAFLVLAPWGIDSKDLLGTVRAAIFGFTLGGVTISLSTLVGAVIIFGIGFAITRGVQNWLETRYLPATGLDVGLRNSISTILGYIGLTVAAALALSQLGLSIDKLTLVAGALSVGIGFGLQSIVNNFVSGLILLWERPIRVGDWIDVGAEQGIVKRINVRATEIVTFDRASLIVPNSEFISGRVKNWVHDDRIGRIIIPISVAAQADPDEVQDTLLKVALSHREVLSEPKPRVFFIKIAAATLDFELRCFADIDSLMSVKSELTFDLFRRLRAMKIEVPPPRYAIDIADMDRLGAAIAGAQPRPD